MTDIRRGYLYIFLTSVLFGINTMAIRYYFVAFGNHSIQTVAFWSLTAASIIVLPYFVFNTSSHKRMKISVIRDGKIVLAVAFLSSAGAFFWYVSLGKIGAGAGSLAAKSQVLYSALLGVILLRERFTAFETAGMILALSGVAVISQLPGEVNLIGMGSMMLSALIYSVQSYIVKRFGKDLHGVEFSYLRAALMGIIYGITFALSGTLEILPFKEILFLGLFSMTGLMIGRTFYYEAHKYLGISRIGIGMLFEPILILIGAFFILDESLSAMKLGGAFLILFGLWMTAAKNLKLRKVPWFLKS